MSDGNEEGKVDGNVVKMAEGNEEGITVGSTDGK